MRVKVFRAASLRAAITLLREELGPDALLLSSREDEEGVEVTAAVEPPETTAADLERFDEVPPPPPDAALIGHFVWHNLAPALVDALSPRGSETLADACARRLCFSPLDPASEAMPAPVLVCGPAGAGRSSAIAALAAQSLAAGRRPMVITADTRPGAPETLAARTRALGLMLIVADRPETLARALARCAPGTVVLVDTPPLDAHDAAQMAATIALAQSAGAVQALVVPAGIDPLEAAEYSAALARHPGSADRLLISRADRSGRLGGALAACVAGNLALAGLCGLDRDANATLLPLTAAHLATRLSARRPEPPSGHVAWRPSPILGPVSIPIPAPAAQPSPPAAARDAVGGRPEVSGRHVRTLAAHIAAQKTRG